MWHTRTPEPPLTSYVICWYKLVQSFKLRPVKFQFLSCDNINSVFNLYPANVENMVSF